MKKEVEILGVGKEGKNQFWTDQNLAKNQFNPFFG